MKKNILVYVLILTIIFTVSCKEKSSKDLFKDFIPKSLPNYEYIIQNPMINNFYITDLDSIKGKIIKTCTENYELYDDGKIFSGDNEDKAVYNSYYFFNDDGEVFAIYELNGYSKEFDILLKKIFQYSENKYVQTLERTRLYNNTKEKESTTYEIKKEKSKLYVTELNLTNKTTTRQKIYEEQENKLVVVDNSVRKGVVDTSNRIEYVYENDKVTSNEYRKSELYRTREKLKNINVLTIERRPEFMDIWTLKEFNGNIFEVFKKEKYDGTILKENIQHLIITKYHPAGFIEYSYKGPEIEGSSGNYLIYRAEILDKPDDLLLKYFPELKE